MWDLSVVDVESEIFSPVKCGRKWNESQPCLCDAMLLDKPSCV